MQFQNIIIVVIFIISILIVMSLFKTFINTKRVNKIHSYLKDKQFVKFYCKKCYYSATGFKKNYPSYPCSLEIYLTENEVIFIGKNNFPFIFKTVENPFALSKNPNNLQNNIDLKRVFKPTKVYATDKVLNFNFIDNITFKTNIDYQIDLEISQQTDELKRINDWC
jgi:Tfp pilus assembly protein PilE